MAKQWEKLVDANSRIKTAAKQITDLALPCLKKEGYCTTERKKQIIELVAQIAAAHKELEKRSKKIKCLY